jgi:hypothetical protein
LPLRFSETLPVYKHEDIILQILIIGQQKERNVSKRIETSAD